MNKIDVDIIASGMVFAYEKKIIVISIPELTDGKSFQNMVTEWAGLED